MPVSAAAKSVRRQTHKNTPKMEVRTYLLTLTVLVASVDVVHLQIVGVSMISQHSFASVSQGRRSQHEQNDTPMDPVGPGASPLNLPKCFSSLCSKFLVGLYLFPMVGLGGLMFVIQPV